MRIPAVIYAAKSTQDKHLSIPTQIKDCQAKAVDEDWEVVDEFKDEGFSAYSGNRGPGLERAKRAAADAATDSGGICMLVAQHSDRFARGAGDQPGAADSLIEIWHAMRRENVHLRSKQNDSMLGDPLLVAAASKLAYEESARKSDATKSGMERRAVERGQAAGGIRAFGYRWGENKTGLLVVAHEAAVVEGRMYEATLAGATQQGIMRELEADGIKTVRGGRWHQGGIGRILRNPLYKGMIVRHGEELPGRHDAIVSPGLWGEVNDLLASRAKTGKGRGRRPEGSHLFRKGMLRCVCEEPMVPRTDRNRQSGPREVYICYGRHRDPSSCSMSSIARERIDSPVYRYFEQVGLDVEATRMQLADARHQKIAEIQALSAEAEAEKNRADERLARVRRDYTDGKLTAEDWSAFNDELSADLAGAEAELARFAEQRAEVTAWGQIQDVEHDVLAKLADLRATIAGELSSAAGVDAVRAALLRIFDGFSLRRPEIGRRVHADLAWGGDLIIEPMVKERVVEGYTSLRPVFRREPLYDAENKYPMANVTG